MTTGIGRNKVVLAYDAPSIQWANGKNEARRVPSTGRFASHVGWYSEVGKDEDFDAWCEHAGVVKLEMRHPRQGGPAQVVTHWDLGETLRIFPLTSGPTAPNVRGSVRDAAATADAGIGVKWAFGDGERSKLAFRGYLQVSGKQGNLETYDRPVQLSTRSRMTDELLAALIDHVRVCELADTLVDRAKHPGVVELYEIALPLGGGVEAQWGKGETTTVTPIVSGHSDTPDLPYLRELWRPAGVVEWAQRDWTGVQSWARQYSAGAAAVSYEDAL